MIKGKTKGRILRIKQGYNPNSSSVGSDIPMFLFSSAALVLLAGIATQVHSIITARFQRQNKNGGGGKKRENAR